MLRTLLLEDSPRDVEIIRELLIDAGFDPDMSCTAEEKEFVSFLRSRTYDIILADFKLPGFDAFAALRWAKEICPDVPFICVSGSIGEETAVELLKLGAVDYVLKDRLVRLPSAIKRALGEAKEKKTRRRVEDSLQESEQRLNFHLQNTPMGIVEWGVDFIVTRWSGEAEKIFGWGSAETIGKSIMDLHMIYDEDAAIVQNVMKRLSEGVTRNVVSTNRNYTKSGKMIYCEWYNSVLMNSQNKMVSVMSQVLDITERKKAEEALWKSEEIFRHFMEHSPIYVFFKDENIQAIQLSKNFETMLGKPMAELLGKNMDDLFPAELSKSMIADDMRILTEGKEITVEEELNGRLYTTIKFPIHIEGKPRYLAGYTIDITERKHAEEKIFRQLEELKRWQEVTLGREDRIRQLKHEVNELLNRAGETTRYPSQESDSDKDQPNKVL